MHCCVHPAVAHKGQLMSPCRRTCRGNLHHILIGLNDDASPLRGSYRLPKIDASRSSVYARFDQHHLKHIRLLLSLRNTNTLTLTYIFTSRWETG
jgi:hypothetical protein